MTLKGLGDGEPSPEGAYESSCMCITAPCNCASTNSPVNNPCGSGYSWDDAASMCSPSNDFSQGAATMQQWLRTLQGQGSSNKPKTNSLTLSPTLLIAGAAVVLVLMSRR